MMDLQENLQQVEANICKACENAGRKRSDVTLIAVSKTTPVFSMYSLPEFHREDLIRPKCLNDGFDLIRCQQIGLA